MQSGGFLRLGYVDGYSDSTGKSAIAKVSAEGQARSLWPAPDLRAAADAPNTLQIVAKLRVSHVGCHALQPDEWHHHYCCCYYKDLKYIDES